MHMHAADFDTSVRLQWKPPEAAAPHSTPAGTALQIGEGQVSIYCCINERISAFARIDVQVDDQQEHLTLLRSCSPAQHLAGS